MTAFQCRDLKLDSLTKHSKVVKIKRKYKKGQKSCSDYTTGELAEISRKNPFSNYEVEIYEVKKYNIACC